MVFPLSVFAIEGSRTIWHLLGAISYSSRFLRDGILQPESLLALRVLILESLDE